MLGVVLTVLAVFVVICFALCYSDRPSGSAYGTDTFFQIKPKDLPKDPERRNPQRTDPIVNR
jgi:hypothetical protein